MLPALCSKSYLKVKQVPQCGWLVDFICDERQQVVIIDLLLLVCHILHVAKPLGRAKGAHHKLQRVGVMSHVQGAHCETNGMKCDTLPLQTCYRQHMTTMQCCCMLAQTPAETCLESDEDISHLLLGEGVSKTLKAGCHCCLPTQLACKETLPSHSLQDAG